jgi:hypothetical protein
MKPEPEAASRGPPVPYEIEGERYYNARQAAQIIGTVSAMTLGRWIKHGTPFGLEICSRTVPVTHHRRSTQTPRTFRQSRLLISAAKVDALRELLHDRRPGPISPKDLEWLKAEASRFHSPLSHLTRPSPP